MRYSPLPVCVSTGRGHANPNTLPSPYFFTRCYTTVNFVVYYSSRSSFVTRVLLLYIIGFFLPIDIDDVKNHRAEGDPDKSPHKSGNHVARVVHPQIHPANADKQDQ